MANQHTKKRDDEAKAKADLLDVARKRAKQAKEAEGESRTEGLEDLRFRAGEQWPPAIKAKREAAGKPCLTVNRLPQFEKQVTNDMRRGRPAIQVNPVDDVADPKTAEVIQGLIRHIEYDSKAAIAYERGGTAAVRCGFGYWRVLPRYVGEDTFEQELRIESIRDPFMVMLDPAHVDPTGADAKWGFIFEDMERHEFEAMYPDADTATESGFQALGTTSPDWLQGKDIRVAEYFWVEYQDATLYELEDGTTTFDVPEDKPKRKRKVQKPQWKWAKITGNEILEGPQDWAGSLNPIIATYGDEIVVDGKIIHEGLIRNSRDSQRMANYWASKEAEAIALAPNAPYIMAEGQDEGHEDEWASANLDARAYLTYKPVTIDGNLAGAPQRIVQEPAIQAISHARMQCNEDLKAIIGIYDPSLGNRDAAQSGVAIRSLQSQGQNANFHFIDNLHRSIEQTGRVLLDLIPKVYDTARTLKIIGDDESAKVVKVNQPAGEVGEDGMEIFHDLTVGKYDVVISAGPSFQTKRQEEAAFLEKVMQAYPPLMQVAGDLVFRAQDSPGSAAIADRIAKTLPPGLKDEDQKKGQTQIPAEFKAQMDQLMQQHEQLTQALQAAHDQVEELAAGNAAKIRAEQIKAETDIKVAEIRARAEIVKAQLSAQVPGAEQNSQNMLAQLSDLQELVLAMHERMVSQPEAMPLESEPEPVEMGQGETPGLMSEAPTAGPEAGMEQE